MQNVSNTPAMAPNVIDHKLPHNKGTERTVSANAAVQTGQAEEVTQPKTSVQQQLNATILQANLDVSINSGNEPLALLYKAAIEGINEVLEPELGANAIENAYESGIDFSPEATAQRIVSMSTAYFGSYQKLHPELTDQEAAIKFADIIGGGVQQGFSEAREILDGLNVLEGDIASNVDKTYDLVQSGLKAFVEGYTETDTEEDSSPVEGELETAAGN